MVHTTSCFTRSYGTYHISFHWIIWYIPHLVSLDHMWPSTGKPVTTWHPSKKFFLHLQSCRRPDIELSKFYHRSFSRSHYNRPNRSLLSAWNNTFLKNWSIFSDIYARRIVPGFTVDGHIWYIRHLVSLDHMVHTTSCSTRSYGTYDILFH